MPGLTRHDAQTRISEPYALALSGNAGDYTTQGLAYPAKCRFSLPTCSLNKVEPLGGFCYFTLRLDGPKT